MSVPLHKRSASNKEYYHHFQMIFNSIFYYITKDFGIKTVVRDLQVFENNAKMEKDDIIVFNDLCHRYNLNVESQYPYWVLESFRNEIMNALFRTLRNMTTADGIYPSTDYEYNLKRDLQHQCIGDLNYILQIFQKIIFLYPVNQEKYQFIVTEIDKNIAEFRNWKKRTNAQYRNGKANRERMEAERTAALQDKN